MDSAGHYLRENLSVIVENLDPNLLIQADGLILENDDIIKFKNRENIFWMLDYQLILKMTKTV